MKSIFFLLILLLSSFPHSLSAQDQFSIARIQYRGGGDWYNDPSALSNLIAFAKEELNISIRSSYDDVPLGSRKLHQYPFAFLTGHGTIDANPIEIRNLRKYLANGGFLYIDDDYGLDKHVRALLKEAFPSKNLLELPFDHPIYNAVFSFRNGLPKVHEHDGKPPQGFGLFIDGRLAVFYSYESNLADAWTDIEVHKPVPRLRQRALEMGVNILQVALTQVQ